MKLRADEHGDEWARGLDLVLEEARRSIDAQRTDLADLRQRTGLIAGLSGVAATLWATAGNPVGATHGSLCTGLLVGAVIAFLWVMGLSLAILQPRGFSFEHDASILLSNFRKSANGTTLIYNVCEEFAEMRAENADSIARLNILFRAAIVMLGLEVLLLLLCAVVG